MDYWSFGILSWLRIANINSEAWDPNQYAVTVVSYGKTNQTLPLDAFIRKTGKGNSTEALPTSLVFALCRITGRPS
jgi:hypothetical protein